MATTIVTKKGSGAPAASDLVEGELAVDTTNGRLYTENSSAAVVELGSNPSGNITFGDNGKAIFGAGSDATLHSDGSAGYARGFVLQNTAGDKDVLSFVDGGAATLFHNNAAKIATTATGVDVTGTVSATNVSLPDDGVLSLGASDELTIKHHNSGYSHLINTTGTLYIDSDSVTFRDDDGSPSNMVVSQTGIAITGTATGATSFSTAAGGTFTTAAGNDLNIVYPDGRSLFFKEAGTTTLTLDNAQGATFAGTIAAGAATFTTADNTDTLSLISTDADASVGPNLRMYRNSASPADSDILGVIDFEGRNDNSQDVVYAQILSQANDVSDGSEDGSYYINTMLAGTITNRINVVPSEIVFNEESKDLDFRVESDSNTHMLFVDAGNDRVGIGRTPVGVKLDILGGNGDQLKLDNSGERFTQQYWQHNGSPKGAIWVDSTDAQFEIYGYAGYGTTIHTNATERANFKSTGEVVFNDISADYDFRVESDSNTHALFVDASTNCVNIQTAGGVQSIAGLNSRVNGAAIEFGHTNNSAGYFGTLGAQGNNGHPYLGFSTSAEFNVNTFRTYGAAGNIIAGDMSGNLLFSQVVTASAVNQTPVERMRIDSSGRVGIGCVPATPLNVAKTGDGTIVRLLSVGLGEWDFSMGNSSTLTGVGAGALELLPLNSGTGSEFAIGQAGSSTAVFHIKSGNVHIATSATPSASQAGFLFTSDQLYTSAGNTTNSNTQVRFINGNGLVGSISTAGSGTAYATSSDYRLKENVVAMSGATERLKQLKPSRFNFIADADTTVDGFLAHEVQDIVPEAITGTKDAVDGDGNPEYQGIDQSKLVPLLVATIQELEARITALES